MEEYPEYELTENWREILARIPIQAWWAEEDEPWIFFSEEPPRSMPYKMALLQGLIRKVQR